MKDTLEYKILKYLQENDTGKFLDITFLIEDSQLLQSKIKDLKNNGLIEYRKFILEDGHSRRFDCKIILKGKEYIFNISDKNSRINNIDFRGATVGQFNQSDELNVLETKINQTIYPEVKNVQGNKISSFFIKFWWQILIPLIIGIVLIAIDKKWIIVN